MTPAGFTPELTLVLPQPTGNLKWFGGAFGLSDIQIREGEDGCDGCERGVVELVSVPSEKDAIHELHGLKNVKTFDTSPSNIFGLQATEIRARLGSGLSHVFGGIELGRGEIHAYVATVNGESFAMLLGGEDQIVQADIGRIRLSAAR